jgi:Flp pilus assembly protein protease CpaA
VLCAGLTMRHTPRMVRFLADVAPARDPSLGIGIAVTGLLCCTAVVAGVVVLVIFLVRRRQRSAEERSQHSADE